MYLFLFLVLNLSIFIWSASKYNGQMKRIMDLNITGKFKKEKQEEIKLKIDGINTTIKTLKTRTYLIFGLAWLLYNLVTFFKNDGQLMTWLTPLIVFVAFILLITILYWLKGASVVPRFADQDKSDNPFSKTMGNPYR
jgi:hypothetical protein